MAAARFIERLNEQIAYEFSASQQYIANAVYYDAQTLPRLAAFFYAQAVEERNHAMMMVQYLLDSDAQVTIPAVTAARDRVRRRGRAGCPGARPGAPRQRPDRGADRGGARRGRLSLSEQFVQWFLKEQVEEVASMSSLLAVVQRSSDNPMQIEDYLAREHSARGRGRPDRSAGGGRRALGAAARSKRAARSRRPARFVARRARRRGGSSPSRRPGARAAPARTSARFRARRAAGPA